MPNMLKELSIWLVSLSAKHALSVASLSMYVVALEQVCDTACAAPPNETAAKATAVNANAGRALLMIPILSTPGLRERIARQP
jgi:hypothetical protein